MSLEVSPGEATLQCPDEGAELRVLCTCHRVSRGSASAAGRCGLGLTLSMTSGGVFSGPPPLRPSVATALNTALGPLSQGCGDDSEGTRPRKGRELPEEPPRVMLVSLSGKTKCPVWKIPAEGMGLPLQLCGEWNSVHLRRTGQNS